MVTPAHAPVHLTILPVPRSARDVPAPSEAAMAWVIDEAHQLVAVDRDGTQTPRPLPDGRRALEVSCGADGTLWVLADGPSGPGGGGDGALLIRYAPSVTVETIQPPVAVSKVAAGPDGTLWLVNRDGEVLSMTAGGETRRHSPAGESLAEEISVGPDGSVWVISTTSRYAGRIVKRLSDPDGGWFDLPAPASATKVGVAPDGMAWTINSRGEVWRLHPLGGGSLAECQVDTACSECRFSVGQHVMTEIGVSPDGTVWTIGTADGDDRPALRRLADPARRAYETIATARRPLRVAGGLQEPANGRA
jgi:streptogramin lyase